LAKKRSKVIVDIRHFFEKKNVVEVETPSLSAGTVTDPFLDAFTTKYSFLSDMGLNKSKTLYLQTSPEFHMKRLLTSGYGCIYQICKAFRHEEFGRQHNPEFTILEWYRLGFNQHDLIEEVSQLLATILKTPSVEKITYQALFTKYVAVDPLNASFEELYSVIQSHGKAEVWLFESNDCDLLQQFIFSEIIENNIGLEEPCFVYNFPIAQASLAKECPEDSRVAQRFECYFKGIELANGFNELTDPKVQEHRFNLDNDKRQYLGLSKRNIDNKFIKALYSGLPQCSGVAIGIDRLMMIALDKSSIDEVLSFPIEQA